MPTTIFLTPPLSSLASHSLALLFASLYVGSLYISKSARLKFKTTPFRRGLNHKNNGAERTKEKSERWRDDPDVIQARMFAATLATIAACAIVYAVLWEVLGPSSVYFDERTKRRDVVLSATLTRLGFTNLWAIDQQDILSHFVTPMLFLGPLYVAWLDQLLPFQKNWHVNENVVNAFLSWKGLRDYTFAPITEEIVFRACVVAVYRLSGVPRSRLMFLTPLSFGLAHVHHFWDTFNRYGRTRSAAKRAVITILVQLSYTTLFGAHCCFLFLRTGSIYAPISAHIFCNIMGLPTIVWDCRRLPHRRYAIILVYVLGVVGFVYALGAWTLVNGSLYWRLGKQDDMF